MRIFRSRTKTHKPLTHKAFVLWVPLCLLAALSLFIPSASTISEENVDVNVNLVNGVAIRILNSAATAEITELDLSTTAAPTGTFVTDNFKVEVSTANKTGYKLYMNSSYQNPSTSTYTTDLVNQTDTSYTIPTVAAAVSKTDLSTAAPGTTNANKWAYSLDDTTYSPVPANSVQTQIGSHDTPTAGTKTPVYIGMNVNVEKPSGVYKNQLTFSAVGNPVPTDYTLYFEPGGTGVSGLPETMAYSGMVSSHTFTIPANAPSRSGYGFTGYLDTATSTTYQPGDNITIVGDEHFYGEATLTAQWTSSTLIQVCSATTTSNTFAYNGVEYIKLADGNCYTKNSQGTTSWDNAWSLCPSGTNVPTQTQFANLGSQYSGGGLNEISGWNGHYWTSTEYDSTRGYRFYVDDTRTSADGRIEKTTQYQVACIISTPTNIANMQQMTSNVCAAMSIGDTNTLTDIRDTNTYTIAKLADERCWMTQNLRLIGPRELTATNSNVTTDFDLTASNSGTWCFTFDQGCIDQSMVLDSGSSTYGAYYNWYAATAGTGKYETVFATVSSSICPKGWKLPSNSDFLTLKNNYATVSDLTATPYPAFVFSGDRVEGQTVNQDSSGFYWSSTATSENNNIAVRLSFTTSGQYAVASNGKPLGFTVRCVAQQ